LESGEQRMRATLEGALDCVVSMDADGRITYLNHAAERTFGVEAAAVIGREMAEVMVPPSLRAAHRAGLERHLTTGEKRILDQRIEITGMRSDGEEFPAELTVTRLGLDAEPSFTAYIRDITEQKLAERALRDARRRAIEAADAERRRVTRDLHDGVQQDLVNVVVNLQLTRDGAEGSAEAIAAASSAADRALDALRELAAGIHPAILTNRGLGAAVRSLAKRAPLPVEIVEVPDGRRFPAEMEASLYFFISEALTNVIKHAGSSRAWVSVTAQDALRVTVGDDGVGGARLDRFVGGLVGLSDRIAALDGTLEIESEPGEGTQLIAEVPLPNV